MAYNNLYTQLGQTGSSSGTGGYSTANVNVPVGDVAFGASISPQTIIGVSTFYFSTTLGQVGIGTATGASGNEGPEILSLYAPSSQNTLSLQQGIGNSNNYLQYIIKNLSSGTTASADFVAGNNLNTPSTFYADMGINASGFVNQGLVGAANDVYFYGVTTSNVWFGAASTSNIYIFTGGGQIANAVAAFTGTATNGLGSFGISTVTPTNTLHVQGSSRFTGTINDSSNNSGGYVGIVTQFLSSIGTASVWQPVKRGLVATLMMGSNPTGLGTIGNSFVLPYDPNDGATSVNFTFKRATLRAESGTAGISTFQLQKLTGSGQFVGVSSVLQTGLLLNGASAYSVSTTAFNVTTCNSGDVIAPFAIGIAHTNYSMEIILRET